MSLVVQTDEHVDEATGEYGETGLFEVRDLATGEVIDCCLEYDDACKYLVELPAVGLA
jgi:hypothetical protein